MARGVPAGDTVGMDLGFETIGNACIIAHDKGPVLATDPWLHGPAYFGSWILSHEVPAEQQQHVKQCRYLWISHGHPDHLSLPSLETLRDKKILLPDHHGGRVARELRSMGFDVTVLEDGKWVQLSPRLRIASVANFNQDASLLLDLGDHLVIDANDAGDRGTSKLLRRELPRFGDRTYLSCLTGYGDADMIHFFDEQGVRIQPPAMQKPRLGPGIHAMLCHYGIRTFVPGSAMHRYQRTDSAWANACTTPVHAHAEGFPDDGFHRILPAFVAVDLTDGSHRCIDPRPSPDILRAPEEFGDSWSSCLEAEDMDRLRAYFGRFEHLRTFLGYVTFRVGGRDHVVDIAKGQPRGITFAVPRESLLQAVEWNAFDDLLIGNFMRTTLHGDWWGRQGSAALYPHFTPFVTKFGDNGTAYSAAEIRAYFEDYLRRGFTEFGPDPADVAMGQAVAPYLRG